MRGRVTTITGMFAGATADDGVYAYARILVDDDGRLYLEDWPPRLPEVAEDDPTDG